MVPADNERRTRVSVLNINPDFHSSSLRRGAQVQEIDHSFGGPGVKALIAWNGVDNDQLCGMGMRQSEGPLKRSQSGLPNVHRAEHPRECFHDFVLRC
jgi:hypothetical protein